MDYLTFKHRVKTNIFTSLDVAKYFPEEQENSIKTQLARFSRRKLIYRLKRDLYTFDTAKIDELALAQVLYQPSYVSLESAIAYYGLIPDVPMSVTSITTTTTKKIKTTLGTYLYSKVSPKLYFGFNVVEGSHGSQFLLAEKEKALLDYMHVRRVKNMDYLRLDKSKLDRTKFEEYAKAYELHNYQF